MERLAAGILRSRRAILTAFLIAIALSPLLARTVRVNYDLVQYLPADSPSTIALDVMGGAFDEPTPNGRIMIPDVTIPQALEYKSRISAVQGVRQVNWLDDLTDIRQPVESIPQETLDDWYRDDTALFTVVLESGNLRATIAAIRSIIGESGAMAGPAIDTANAQETTGSQISKMILFIVPVVLGVLMMTTSSWFEPLLFLATIGVSILINAGTNAILGEVSFITQATSAILQLAVSMDYSIFLLHRFAEFRAQGLDVQEAMANAMAKSFSSILASGLTTVLGFVALLLMRFKIGPDMGVVLAKGIFFSLASVMLLLPVLTISTYKMIDKTHHRSLVPSFAGFGRTAAKVSRPLAVVVLALLIPAYLAQTRNDFLYGSSAMSSTEGSRSWLETERINGLFGKFTTMVLLYPEDGLVLEDALAGALRQIPVVSSATSYGTTVGTEIPEGFLPASVLSQFVSEGYRRMVLTVTTKEEGPQAFAAVESIRATAKRFLGDDYYLLGSSVNVYDMRQTVIADNKLVSIGAIGGVWLVLLFTFRSLVTPFILLLAIQSSIWINMCVPYFAGQSMAYIGYMIISSVELGATVDYAILFANRYIENRQLMPRNAAVAKTVSDTTASILTSAGILATCGFVMGLVSTNGVIGQFGILIGRGAVLSASMVLLFLPATIAVSDGLMRKTTLGGLPFFKEVDGQ